MKKIWLSQIAIAVYLISTQSALSKSFTGVSIKDQNIKNPILKTSKVKLSQDSNLYSDININNKTAIDTNYSKIPSRIEQLIVSDIRDNGTQTKLLLPLYQSQKINHLLYLDLRAEIDNQPSHQFDVGIGYRKLLPATSFLNQKQWILGLYGAYGESYSKYKNQFQQSTFGVEALSEVYDFRANAYIAKDRQAKVNNYTRKGGDDLYYWDDTYSKYQIALTGVDFEAGYKLPISKINSKLYIGGYFYQKPKTNDESVAVSDLILYKHSYNRVNGQKVRLEIELDHNNTKLFNKNTTMTFATEYKHDRINQGQLYGIVKISYQFGNNNSSSLSNNSDQERNLYSRMNEFTVRNFIVTQKSEELIRKNILFHEASGEEGGGSTVGIEDI
jgi:hypothetical protein